MSNDLAHHEAWLQLEHEIAGWVANIRKISNVITGLGGAARYRQIDTTERVYHHLVKLRNESEQFRQKVEGRLADLRQAEREHQAKFAERTLMNGGRRATG